jgi:hypothetical protein
MSTIIPAAARAYYEHLPPQDNRCGDIWDGLPDMGLLGGGLVKGLIISPACDLSNFKTETMTFLPILPVRAYLRSAAFLPVLRREIQERYQAAGIDSPLAWPEPGNQPPSKREIEYAIVSAETLLSRPNPKSAFVEHATRAIAGLRIIAGSAASSEESLSDFELLFGRKWSDLKAKIVSNSLKPDLHFLPRCHSQPGVPSISSHSVVLLRYPITVATDTLIAAQSYSPSAWSQHVTRAKSAQSNLVHFSAEVMPIKILTLRPSFLSDLLSRFIALYVRIGSPDFSTQVVDRITKELDL